MNEGRGIAECNQDLIFMQYLGKNWVCRLRMQKLEFGFALIKNLITFGGGSSVKELHHSSHLIYFCSRWSDFDMDFFKDLV